MTSDRVRSPYLRVGKLLQCGMNLRLVRHDKCQTHYHLLEETDKVG